MRHASVQYGQNFSKCLCCITFSPTENSSRAPSPDLYRRTQVRQFRQWVWKSLCGHLRSALCRPVWPHAGCISAVGAAEGYLLRAPMRSFMSLKQKCPAAACMPAHANSLTRVPRLHPTHAGLSMHAHQQADLQHQEPHWWPAAHQVVGLRCARGRGVNDFCSRQHQLQLLHSLAGLCRVP